MPKTTEPTDLFALLAEPMTDAERDYVATGADASSRFSSRLAAVLTAENLAASKIVCRPERNRWY